MKLPFMLVSTHQVILDCAIQRADSAEKRLKDAEDLNRKLMDMVWEGQFGHPLFADVPKFAEQPESETTQSKIEKEHEELQASMTQRLQSLRHTSPSKMASEIQRIMQSKTEAAATNGHPAHSIFAAARAEAGA